MKEFLLTILLIQILTFSILSQCDSTYVLCSQGEIDSFQINYGPCTHVNNLVLEFNCDYTNLDGLRDIERVDFLRISGGLELETLAGLENLYYVKFLQNQLRSYHPEGFPVLDTIERVRHFFYADPPDLTAYKNLKYLRKTISLNFSGYFTGAGAFKTSEDFSIFIRDNHFATNFTEIIDSEMQRLDSFLVANASNISFAGLENIDTVNWLVLGDFDDTSLDGLHNISTIETQFLIFGHLRNFEWNGGFSNLEIVPIFNLSETIDIRSLSTLLPNLTHISRALKIENNGLLRDVSLIDNFMLPDGPDYFSLGELQPRILIEGNGRLEECHSPYICNALMTYPDSVIITNNTGNCDEMILQQSLCNTSAIEDHSESVSIFPNPAIDYLYTSVSIDAYEIYNTEGKEIKSSLISPNIINVSEVEEGLYFLHAHINNKTYVHKFLKIRR